MAINNFADLAQKILREKASYQPANPDVEIQTVFDRESNRYLMLHVGWRGESRVYGCVIHLEIKDGKIWVEQNMTEMRGAQKLVERGVQKEDIVLGFQSPDMRQYTEYAAV